MVEEAKYSRVNPYLKKVWISAVDPAQFNALIREYGCRVIYEHSTLCPCYYGRIESGQKNIVGCKKCENGYKAFDQTEISVFIHNTDLEKQFQQVGVMDIGSAKMYCPSQTEDGKDFIIGYFDRMTVLDYMEPYTELVQRGKGDVDYLSFKALEIKYLATEKHVYNIGQDFEINVDGNIKWIGIDQPTYNQERDLGEAYTIYYMRNPVYRVVQVYQENRFALSKVIGQFKYPERLIQECLIKKDFLITKTDVRENNVGVQLG
ncbi:MAG: hypothetical protein V1897_15915 [Pseudomonadota bacterium]